MEVWQNIERYRSPYNAYRISLEQYDKKQKGQKVCRRNKSFFGLRDKRGNRRLLGAEVYVVRKCTSAPALSRAGLTTTSSLRDSHILTQHNYREAPKNFCFFCKPSVPSVSSPPTAKPQKSSVSSSNLLSLLFPRPLPRSSKNLLFLLQIFCPFCFLSPTAKHDKKQGCAI